MRLLSLALLFGGSVAVVFVAIVLVKAAKAKGIPVPEAAAANAPAFIEFAKIAAGSAITLIIAEAMDFMANSAARTKLTIGRYVVSGLCVAATFVFSFGVVPPMKALLPSITTDEAKKAEFDHLHELSRAIFGGTIFFAMLALILSGLESLPDTRRNELLSELKEGLTQKTS